MRMRIVVKPDHISALARRNDPLGAVEELVWNGLDADAKRVDVSFEVDGLGGVGEVVVHDYGSGITPERIASSFTGVGGSWKKDAAGTGTGRALHGRHGHGRFRVLALGSRAEWDTVAVGVGGPSRSRITFAAGDEVFDSETVDGARGDTFTRVRVVGDAPRKTRLQASSARQELTARLAVYLTKYPGVTVTWQGEPLDPQDAIACQEQFDLDVDGTDPDIPAPRLRVIEWKVKPKRKELLLCDADGVNRVTLTAPPAASFGYTAYVLWDELRTLSEHEYLDASFEAEDTLAGRVTAAARARLAEYFAHRARRRTKELVDRWRDEEVYPYDVDASNARDRVEREVFNEVAAVVHTRLRGGKPTRRVQFVLLKEALRKQPIDMAPVLHELFALKPSQRQQLDALLDRTTLGGIIAANTQTTGRLDFLAGLRALLFEDEGRRALREVDQLHPMLEKEPWVFGEQFTDVISERGLTEVLARHLPALRGEPRRRVVKAEGRTRRLDLVLSGASGSSSSRQHLVVELKRPDVTLKTKEFDQLFKYAYAVMNDDRYKQDHATRWDFWLVGNKIDEQTRWQYFDKDSNLPDGCFKQAGNLRLWARTWGEIVSEAEDRLRTVQDLLEYQSDTAHAADYLDREHQQADVVRLLPPA